MIDQLANGGRQPVADLCKTDSWNLLLLCKPPLHTSSHLLLNFATRLLLIFHADAYIGADLTTWHPGGCRFFKASFWTWCWFSQVAARFYLLLEVFTSSLCSRFWQLADNLQAASANIWQSFLHAALSFAMLTPKSLYPTTTWNLLRSRFAEISQNFGHQPACNN